jgi:hypothetical protein
MSARLKLDANGELTDEGSGADDFAGPIIDRLVGFDADGAFHFVRADALYSSPGPAYREFVKEPGGTTIGARLGGGPFAAVSTGGAAMIEVPASTPQAPAAGSTDREGGSLRYAPVVIDAADSVGRSTRCDSLQWIDATRLLCSASSSGPIVLDLAHAVLTPADAAARTGRCNDCYGRQYAMVLPAGAVTDLVPKTQRELSGFVVRPSDGTVLFLAGSGKDALLWAASGRPGGTPTKLGLISLGDDAPPATSYLTLRWL